jgi:hypothetical protein
MAQERYGVKPEDEQYEATVEGLYHEHGLLFYGTTVSYFVLPHQ